MTEGDAKVRTPRLNRDQVIAVVGRIDDDKIADIIATGADQTQLLEAYNRFVRPGEVGAETARPLAGVVLEVYEILRAGEPEWDDSHDYD